MPRTRALAIIAAALTGVLVGAGWQLALRR
jgi:hypothetical protein